MPKADEIADEIWRDASGALEEAGCLKYALPHEDWCDLRERIVAGITDTVPRELRDAISGSTGIPAEVLTDI